MAEHFKHCKYCGREFITTNHRIGYCSDECRKKMAVIQIRRAVEKQNRKRAKIPIPVFVPKEHPERDKRIELAEKEVFALPQVEKKTYSATEIAKILNVSAKKIGALANKYNLKTEQFGKWFYDKSRYSNKEVETFRYYENAISQFRFLLGGVMA